MLWVEHGIRPADVLEGDPGVVHELIEYLADKAADAEEVKAREEMRRRLEAS